MNKLKSEWAKIGWHYFNFYKADFTLGKNYRSECVLRWISKVFERNIYFHHSHMV